MGPVSGLFQAVKQTRPVDKSQPSDLLFLVSCGLNAHDLSVTVFTTRMTSSTYFLQASGKREKVKVGSCYPDEAFRSSNALIAPGINEINGRL